jgi:enoyl-CoA hydratase/carnithine racemase
MTDQIVSALKDGILQIRINRPEKKNALTQEMYAAIATALSEADGNSEVRVITLTGTGDSFTSGNDVADFLRRDTTSSDERPVGRFLASIAALRKPLIAGVNGMAIGVGVTMLLHCDLVYAAEGATFQMPFTNLGVVPEAASSQLLPQMVGYHRATELMLLGERIDAHRALEIGLINGVSPAAELASVVSARAAIIAGKPAASILATKALLRRAPEATAVRMSVENAEFARLLQTPEARAIMQAFLDRRKAG